MCSRAAVPLTLADHVIAVGVHGDVHGALDIVPNLLEIAVQAKDLDTVVLAVADHDIVAVDQKAVGQVELVGTALTGDSP